MTRAKKQKTYSIQLEATVTVSACYEVQASSLEEAKSKIEELFRDELDTDLDSADSHTFDIDNIDAYGEEVEL